MAELTPRDCLHLQIDRDFACTLGCGELESIARHVLMDLAMMNRWDAWLGCVAAASRLCASN